ncbi:substrate-binding periplasmic protein [Leeia sp.]|uniref:substrate-binding periplasmic protein n=1 Tax=Leeia sp. TaxID=2884678 RepID=UPI0035AE2C48
MEPPTLPIRRTLLLLAGLLLAGIAHADRPVLKVLFGVHKPPYIHEPNRSGLDYEIVNQAVQLMGYQLQADFTPPARGVLLFKNADIDALATMRESSGLEGAYSDAYISYQNVATVLAKRGIVLNNIEDLAGYSVAAFQNAKLNLGERYRNAVDKSPSYQEVSPQVIQNKLLYSGRVDVVIGDRLIFRYFNQEAASLVDVKQPIQQFALFPPTEYKVLFRDPAMRDRFNNALRALKARGTYREIEQKYLDNQSSGTAPQ